MKRKLISIIEKDVHCKAAKESIASLDGGLTEADIKKLADGDVCLLMAMAAGNNAHNVLRDLAPRYKEMSTSKRDSYSYGAPLNFAIANGGTMETVKLLIETYGCEVHPANKTSAVVIAIREHRSDVCEYLIDKSLVDVNAPIPPHGSSTPFIAAVEYGYMEFVELMLKRGAGVNVADSTGRTPLMISISKRHSDITNLILSNDAVDVNATRSDSGDSVMHYAAQYARSETIEKLVLRGANVNRGNKDGITPLMVAMTYERAEEPVLVMLKHNADVNAKCNNGNTALHYAAHRSTYDIISLLIAHGADVGARDGERGGTPLHVAAYFDKQRNAKALVDGGSDLTALDVKCRTPVDVSVEQCGPQTMKYFLQTVQRSSRTIIVTDIVDACTICMEAKTSGGGSLMVMSCSHTFHSACMNEWLKRGTSCPICRRGA